MKRCLIEIYGQVQGVGFRPFVHRLAVTHGITGLVRNTLQGVTIEGEGGDQAVQRFLQSIRNEIPDAANISEMNVSFLPVRGGDAFRIEPSVANGIAAAVMPRDRAPCRDCLAELSAPSNRRFQYPFITCNDCGPRFTIAEDLPFDRERTSMRHFELCEWCRREFADPTDRRFHAQTISCPACGPRLLFHTNEKSDMRDEYVTGHLAEAVSTLKQGGLIAVKGVGGYQLICSALARDSIERIRHFKARKLKPFAVMAPTFAAAERLCHISPAEAKLINSPAAPVVLLYVKDNIALHRRIDPAVAPGLPTLGVMLPPSPLHHLLVGGAQEFLVVTSANRFGEPMYTDDAEATTALEGVVDGILAHNRRISHIADDSVVRDAGGHVIVLRHARGLAPTEWRSISVDIERNVVGMGGHTKAAFALAVRGRSILGQHLGDLGSRRARNVYLKELQSYQTIYGLDLSSSITCCDAHPTYDSTALALERVGRVKTIYHHEAHLESLITERGFKGDALGVVCDGSGLGTDGGMWGGEFFLIQDKCRKRIGSLMPFRLPGGERAIREPKRSAFGMLHATYGDASASDPFVLREFNDQERVLIAAALRQEINAPRTTSLGRLFDGLAALLGICTLSDYEAQAPMAMEALAHGAPPGDPLPVTWVQDESGLWQWDWRGLVSAARENEGRDADRRKFAAAFHATIVQVVYELAQRFKVDTILLTGGVFQNAVLVELCQKRLRAAGMSVITHQLIPPGDGGLAIGQIAVECMGEREHVSRNSG